MSARRRVAEGGLTLIELIMFIVIMSVGLAGILGVFNNIIRTSADPVIRKQALSIAESLLWEIEQQPFTYCDPNDPNAATATTTAGCTGGAVGSQDQNGGVLGPINSPAATAETRYSTTTPFDNVSDYAGFTMSSGISDISGTPFPALAAYQADVTITRVGTTFSLSNDAALRITVRVRRGSEDVSVVGYRFRYAPNI